jgi:two-component system, cell cycle sensor histidine kinase and response regulator CckA
VSKNKPLRVLHLEDEPDFSEVVRHLLATGGVEAELQLVSTRTDFEAALTRQEFDIILADYMLPAYNGIEALRLARTRCPATPFLIVSGTIGEQAAIESLQAGATDYVLKLWPDRLAPAVRRAAQEVEERSRREQAETELLKREAYFRALTENSLDVLTILSGEGKYLYNSPSVQQVLGYDPAELQGRSPFELMHPEDKGRVWQEFQQAMTSKNRSTPIEFRLARKDGSWCYVEAVGQNRLQDPAIGGVIVNSRDISDRKRAEEATNRLQSQLRQAQKMEAIGQLAGGVAHDFNNLLTVIHGHASMLKIGGSLSGNAARSAHQIVEATERAASLTRQLLTFSRRQAIQPRPLDLNESVSTVAKLFARILGEDIVLQLHYSNQPVFVHADATMLEQVILNLVLNSRDAMPQGGLLTLKIGLERIEPSRVAPHSEARSGSFGCLTVADNGCGIASEDLHRIFEPFYTTKETGKGTGLGLATAYGIVKQHQGWIEVESAPGRGAAFKVCLPQCARPVEAADPTARPPEIRGGNETILVVEDEAPVRELVCRLLSSYGYRILEAESGARALSLWQECHNQVDLVLTDLVMPDRVNGRELAEKLWADRPRLKVIFTSGYGMDIVGKDLAARRRLNYLPKPYPPERLASAVRECLDAVN